MTKTDLDAFRTRCAICDSRLLGVAHYVANVPMDNQEAREMLRTAAVEYTDALRAWESVQRDAGGRKP